MNDRKYFVELFKKIALFSLAFSAFFFIFLLLISQLFNGNVFYDSMFFFLLGNSILSCIALVYFTRKNKSHEIKIIIIPIVFLLSYQILVVVNKHIIPTIGFGGIENTMQGSASTFGGDPNNYFHQKK